MRTYDWTMRCMLHSFGEMAPDPKLALCDCLSSGTGHACRVWVFHMWSLESGDLATGHLALENN